MSSLGKIQQLTKQLYPTGRAFKIPFGGNLEKLLDALNDSESRAFDDATAIYNSVLPDNDFFTAEDATDWERRLGLITNQSVSLSDRKAAITRKLNHPGSIKARQSASYIEYQLQLADFNVYVHENPDRLSPVDILGAGYNEIWEHGQNYQHGDGEHGTVQTGSVYRRAVANSIDPLQDEFFDIGTDLASVFYIGGLNLGDFANVSQDRELEFRQLILKLKPAYLTALLFINYT